MKKDKNRKMIRRRFLHLIEFASHDRCCIEGGAGRGFGQNGWKYILGASTYFSFMF